MTLDEYMLKKKLANSALSGALGVTPEIVGWWRAGKRTPRPQHMISIYVWSKGVVMPNDFYELPSLHAASHNQYSLLDACEQAARCA